MRIRAAVITALVVSTSVVLGAGPASAAPDAPGVTDLDATTIGHVTGTVTSDQAFVLVSLPGAATTAVDTGSGTGTFDLKTWGYPTGTTVHATACPTDTLDADTCSPETVSDAFDPTDVAPTVTWSADGTVGPGQQASVGVDDPTGGGDLRARWDNTEGSDTDQLVASSGSTDLTLTDGTGTASLVRCAAGSTTRCVALPIATQDYEVRTSATATIAAVTDLTPVHGSTAVTVDTNRTGTYSLTWELQDPITHVPVPTFAGSATGTLDSLGTADPFTISGTGLADGHYDVAVSITVTDPDFGLFPAAPATTTLHSAQTKPTVAATMGTITGIGFGHPTTTATVDTDRSGTYVLEWELEDPVTHDPVGDQAGNASGALDANGAAAPFSISGLDLPSGAYDVAVTLTVTDPDPEIGALAPVHVVGTLHVSVEATATVPGGVAAITPAHPTTSVAVSTDHPGGTYSLTWELQNPVTHVAVATSDVPLTGDLSSAGTAPAFTLPGAGLADGAYDLVASVTVTDADFGELAPATVTTTVTIDTTPPTITTVTRTAGTIWPNVASAARPGSVTFTLNGPDLSDVAAVKVRTGTTSVPLTRAGSTVTWNGRSGSTVAPGTWTLVVVDKYGNELETTGQVVVSSQHLVLKTFTTTVTAKSSKIGQYVGKCSTLRSPSLRKWSGSLGFYANTRCKATDWTSSAASTVHRAVLPSAEKYLDMRVAAYGGAAKTAKTSRALLRYLTVAGSWTAETNVTAKVGTHAGPTRSLNGMVATGRTIYWGFATAAGSRYDLRGFTVVARYYVLG